MHYLLKLSVVILSVASSYVFAENNGLPAVLCVDAESYWDGPYTVEISTANANGEIFASVFSQEREGRFLVGSEIKVQKQLFGTQLTYSGDNFNLELQMESVVATKIHSAEVTFRSEGTFVNGSYLCTFF